MLTWVYHVHRQKMACEICLNTIAYRNSGFRSIIIQPNKQQEGLNISRESISTAKHAINTLVSKKFDLKYQSIFTSYLMVYNVHGHLRSTAKFAPPVYPVSEHWNKNLMLSWNSFDIFYDIRSICSDFSYFNQQLTRNWLRTKCVDRTKYGAQDSIDHHFIVNFVVYL